MADIPTADPGVWIEFRRPGLVRYRNAEGRRWEVHGTCVRLGNCLVGAVLEGFGLVESQADLARAVAALGRARVDADEDVPVTPEFEDCCPFTYVELEPAP